MRDYMKDQRLTQLEASAAGRYLGALEYNLIGADPGSVKGFPRYYRAQTSNEVETCVRTLFGESCALWYENAQPADALDIASMISAHVGLSSENVAQAVRFKFGPAAVTDEWVEYDELPRPLPNPLPDFKAGWRPAALDSWTCLVHGDLHGGNVLVDTRRPETGEAWLIDFARSGRGHWATDLALLEAAVKFQYLDATDLRRLFEFEDALARTAELGPLALEDWEEDSELSKAARIVGAIRSFAGSLGHPHTAAQALQEYQIVLYCYTLNYLRFHSLLKARWRKRQVQVAAAVLHERLRALS
jgi:hypothetical protein